MMPLLYRFRYFDPIRDRWVNARYRATPEQIGERHEKWELLDAGERPSDIGTQTTTGQKL